MEREEGEMSDDYAMQIDDEDEISKVTDAEIDNAVVYKADKTGPVVKKLEKVDVAKLEERAIRFGLDLTGSRVVSQKQIDELYVNCGIKNGNERHFRFDAVHLNGVNGLTTKEIFEYLEDFKPVSMEWVDDNSCNVVCQDHIAAALAMLVHSRDIQNEEVKKILAEKSTHYWREGMPHPKRDLILMRFATNTEKTKIKLKSENNFNDKYDKISNPDTKNPWGDLCRSWGVYDHKEIVQRKFSVLDYDDEDEEDTKVIQVKNKRLADRLGKRKPTQKSSDSDSSSDSEWKKKSKTPRMRMHADDEETKQKKAEMQVISRVHTKEEFAPLSIEVINNHTVYTPKQYTKLSDKFKSQANQNTGRENVLSRLGRKAPVEDNYYSSDESVDYEQSDHNVMSRVQRVSSEIRGASSVWSRLETKSKKSDNQTDLRHILKSRKSHKRDDLRGKLSKSKQSNLRIEIDNSTSD